MKQIPLSPLSYNWELDRDGETSKKPSKTQPDQTMSLRELLTRYTRGQSVPVFDPVFDEDGDEQLPDLSTLSQIEIEELRHDLRTVIATEQADLVRTAAQKKADAKTAKQAEQSEIIDVTPTEEI